MKGIRNYLVAACALLLMFLAWSTKPQAVAVEENKYVGEDVCATCHPDVCKNWALTSHRQTLFNKDASKNGCEACHGPGGQHVSSGGDRTKIVTLSKKNPTQIASTCMKCHKQEHVTLWASGLHARSKVTCLDCHDPHSPDTAMMSKDIENGKTALEGLTTQIQKVQLDANTAAVGSEAKAKAEAAVVELKDQSDKLREKLKTTETAYKRVAEPYVCYNCHKAQQVQTKMPSHHPIPENKMKCSDCHNPHGGPNNMLKEESINETCYKCHAEKAGPFTYEHPAVTESCVNCHNPHGTVHNNLLKQSEPFLCLKCHVGAHTGSNRLTKANAATAAQYYTECTDCHYQIHGSDEHQRMHY